MKQIREIKLTFANADWIIIPFKYLNYFRVVHIVENFYSNNDNAVLSKIAKVNFSVKKCIENRHIMCSTLRTGCTLYTKLQEKNITDIQVMFNDGTVESFNQSFKKEDMISDSDEIIKRDDTNILVSIICKIS